MNKQNESLINNRDSGYDSKFSSFSFDAKCSKNTSTPKKLCSAIKTAAISQQKNVESESFSRNKAANGFKSVGKKVKLHQVAHRMKTSDTNLLLDRKTIALIILVLVFAVFVIAYKMILVAIPYTSAESFHGASSYAQEKFSQVVDWAQENELSKRLNPLFCGLAVSIFTFMMVYMDSAVPGINPAVPFRTNSKKIYGQPKNSNTNLSYLTAFAAGVVVSALMWYEF